jgi:hypothetical protein
MNRPHPPICASLKHSSCADHQKPIAVGNLARISLKSIVSRRYSDEEDPLGLRFRVGITNGRFGPNLDRLDVRPYDEPAGHVDQPEFDDGRAAVYGQCDKSDDRSEPGARRQNAEHAG